MWNKILGPRLINSLAITKLALTITRRKKTIFMVNTIGFTSIVGLCLGVYVLLVYKSDAITAFLEYGDAHFIFPLVSIVAIIIGIPAFIISLGFIHMLTKAYTTALTLGSLRGEPISLIEAMRMTHEKIWPLTQFMFMNMTVGVFTSLLTMLDDYIAYLGTITSTITQTAWSLTTAFTTPLILDNKATSGYDATKRSGRVLMKAFGENVYIQIGATHILGLAFVLMLALGITVSLTVGILTGSDAIMATIAIAAGVIMYILMILILICDTVFAVALYEYAENDNETLTMHKNLFALMLTKKSAAKVFSS